MAEPLQLVITVDDRGSPVVKQFSGNVHNAAAAMDQHGSAATARMSQETGKLTSGLGMLKTAMIAVTAAVAAIGVGKLAVDVVQATSRMAGLEAAMKAAAGSAKGGEQAMAFVRSESNRLGLELTSAADAYKGLVAATVNAGRPMSDAQKIFTGMAEASTAMGMSSEDTSAALLALQQIMGKGKLCYDEETEVLTNRGWLRWAEVRYTDKLATLHLARGRVRFVRPLQLVRDEHYGRMLRIQSRDVDLLVTPDHRMVVRDPDDPERKRQVIRAQDLQDKAYYYTVDAEGAIEVLVRPEDCTWVDNFRGPIYCAVVLWGTLFVRRNGKTCWSGNSAEELQGQLGEKFPAAVGIMSKALGLSTAQMLDMMQKGKLTADVLVKFGDQLHKQFGAQAQAMANSWPATMNRFKNAWNDALVVVGKSGVLDAAISVVQGLTGGLTRLAESGLLEAIGSGVKMLVDWGGAKLKEAWAWIETTGIPLWNMLRTSVGSFIADMLGPMQAAWAALKSQSGESHSILGSFAQTWRYLAEEVFPLVKSQFVEAAGIIGKGLQGLREMVGGFEGAWASVNIAFSAVMELIVQGLQNIMAEGERVFAFFARAADWLGLSGMASGFRGISESIGTLKTDLGHLRTGIQETSKGWEQRLEDARKGYVGIDKVLQDVSTAAVKAGTQASSAAQASSEATVKAAETMAEGVGKSFGAITQRADGTWTNIKAGAEGTATAVQGSMTKLANGAGQALGKITQQADGTWSNIQSGAEQASGGAQQSLNGLGESAGKTFGTISQRADGTWTNMKDGVWQTGGAVSTAMNSMATNTGDALGKIGKDAGIAFGVVQDTGQGAATRLQQQFAASNAAIKAGFADSAEASRVAWSRGVESIASASMTQFKSTTDYGQGAATRLTQSFAETQAAITAGFESIGEASRVQASRVQAEWILANAKILAEWRNTTYKLSGINDPNTKIEGFESQFPTDKLGLEKRLAETQKALMDLPHGPFSQFPELMKAQAFEFERAIAIMKRKLEEIALADAQHQQNLQNTFGGGKSEGTPSAQLFGGGGGGGGGVGHTIARPFGGGPNAQYFTRQDGTQEGPYIKVAAGTPGAIPSDDGSWWLLQRPAATPSQHAPTQGSSGGGGQATWPRTYGNKTYNNWDELMKDLFFSDSPAYLGSIHHGPIAMGSNPYGIKGLESHASGATNTWRGQMLQPGNGEVLLDRSLSDGLRDLIKQGGGGRQVHISNPRFEVVLNGIDPRALNAKQLVTALLPELRESVRRGELES